MYATAEIRGEDVIGLPGQMLTHQELCVLVGVADGQTPTAIAQDAGVQRDELLWIERAIQRKLGARSKPHMITRGFTLRVLIPQALCLLVCFATVAELDHEIFRSRGQRRSRTGAELTRIVRTTPGTSSAGGLRYS